MIVFDDADPATVAEGIKIGGYLNSGQDCTAPRDHRRAEDLRRAARGARAAGRGAEGRRPGRVDDIDMGPVISEAQQERVLGFLERAQGATVLTGGGRIGDRGFFVQPTIVDRRQADRRDRAEARSSARS